MKKLLLILAIFFIIPFVSSKTFTINATENFTIDLIALNESNYTEIIVNIIHPLCNTSANCTICEECNYSSYQENIDQLNSQIGNLNSQITELNHQLEISEINLSFYKERVNNLTSENERLLNLLLTNKTYECPACPSIPACPACPACTIPSLPSCPNCPACNVTCPQPQITSNPGTENTEKEKPSKAPWIISGVLFVMLIITFINLIKKNENKEEPEPVSEEFAEEFE